MIFEDYFSPSWTCFDIIHFIRFVSGRVIPIISSHCQESINQKQVNLQINQNTKVNQTVSPNQPETKQKQWNTFLLQKMNASIVGRYGFRRKSEQRQVALERAWLEVRCAAQSESGRRIDSGLNVDLESLFFSVI